MKTFLTKKRKDNIGIIAGDKLYTVRDRFGKSLLILNTRTAPRLNTVSTQNIVV
jgi:hypothetical protein